MTAALVSLAAFACGALHLWAIAKEKQRLAYVTKPATIVLLAALVALVSPAVDETYRLLILLGLVLSMVGDIFLMLPKDRFLAGLSAFFLAHLAYIGAFAIRLFPWQAPALLALLPYALATAFTLKLLWPTLNGMRVPVAAYAVVLALMAASALAVASLDGQRSAWMAAAGAFLFVISDTALAMDRFVGSLPRARMLVMATYLPAQWLIAASVLGP